jgi:hypothetical protein
MLRSHGPYWIAILAVAQFCHAGDSEQERRNLAGITTVQVLIEQLPPGAINLRLTKESIQTDVELKPAGRDAARG